jgi:osmotically-inducible protein OsmY
MNTFATRALTTGALLVALAACTSTPRSAGETIDDATVTARVKTALIADPTTKAYQINVDTYRQTVKLSGFVDSAEAKARAAEVARGTDGVRSVDNDLTVKP